MKKVTSIILGACMCISFVRPVIAENQVQRIYVSCNGSDSNNGRSEEKAVKTLDKVNTLVSSYLNVFKGQDIEVVFGGGTYDFDKSSTLTSGKDAVKVTYTAKEGEEVVFRGAKDLDSSKFQKVSDEAILSRIPESSRDNVYCMDISDISESFDGHTTGYYGPDGIGYYELIKNSAAEMLSRYPNEGYITGTVVSSDTLGVSADKAALWKSANEYQRVRLNGYLKYDWAYARTYITAVDGSNVSFNRISDVSAASANKFYVADLLEELDSPGEWFIDRTAKILYYYPENGIDASDKYELSVLSEPLISLDRSANIVVKNISFENTRGNAIQAKNSDNITVLNCNFKNVGNNAVIAESCTNFSIDSSSFYNIGSNGVRVSGGDSDTLTQANNKIVNSYFEKVGQVCRSYHGAVTVSGCGNLVANNTMTDTPHQMIGYSGTYNRILYNDIKNACTDSGDMGAIYSGRSVIWRGNEIAYNYIHDIRSKYSDYFLTAGIYLDDGLAGQKVHHNVIKNANEGMFIASGSDNSIHDNIITDCNSAITLSQSNGKEDSYYSLFKAAEDYVSEHPEYLEIFPTLKKIDTEKTLAHGNFIYDNLIVASGCKLYDNNYVSALQFGEGGRNNRRINNQICDSFDGFTDAANGNYAVLPQHEILQKMPNLSMIDMSKIGAESKNEYGYDYEDVLKAEITAIVDNMDKHVSYGDYSYFDTVEEYFAKAEVNEVLRDEFLRNPVYIACVEQRKQYEDMSCIMLDLDYNMHDVYSSAKGYVGSAGYAGAFYYDDFISDKYITWTKPWTDGMIDNVLINDNIRFKLRVVDHKKYTDHRDCVLWNNDENSTYTTIDVKDGYYNTAEILVNADRPTTVRKYLTVVLRYGDGSCEAYKYSMSYFCNKPSQISLVSSTRTVDDKSVGDDYELTDFGYISHRSIPVDNSKKLLAIDVLNEKYNLATSDDGSFVKDENGDFVTELDSGTNRTNYKSSVAIYAVTMTQNKELADKSSDEALLLEDITALINALPEVNKLTWEDKAKLDEIDAKINSFKDVDSVISQISNYDKFLQAKNRMEKLEPKYVIYDMSKLYNAGLIYSSKINLLGNAGYAGAFYYDDFISDKYVSWVKPWTDGMTENTLTSENIPFRLRVIPHDSWKSTGNMIFKNQTQTDDDERYSKFEISDGRYASVQILANSDQGEKKKLGIKVNYTDGTSEVTEFTLQYITNGLNKTGCGGIKSTLCYENATSVEDLSSNGGITHYSVALDTEKTLDNIEILNDRFEFVKDENGEYQKDENGKYLTQRGEGTGRFKFTHTAAIYAVTLETNEDLQGLSDAFDVTGFSLSEKDGKIAAELTLNKLYETDATAYCALYSADGTLLEVKSEQIFDQNDIEFVFESSKKDNPGCTAKYFIWDSKMKPLVTK